jgi:hypothetical protein
VILSIGGDTVLFDPRPKTDRKDLFGRNRELGELIEYMRGTSPVIILLGTRRIGKTSLMRVALKESKLPYIYIDCRALAELGYSRRYLYALFSDGLGELRGKWSTVVEYLKRVRGVSVAGTGIELSYTEGIATITSVLGALDEWASNEGKDAIVIAVDEAQELRNLLGGKGKIDFRKIIAYTYDNLSRVKFLLTGSEVGLLHEFIGREKPDSPLFGRVTDEVILERFDRRTSMEFLKRGFVEVGVNVSNDIIEEVVNVLDGIPGWLTYFGHMYVKGRVSGEDVVSAVRREAVQMAREELAKIVERSRYYRYVLRAVAYGNGEWSKIKKAVEGWTGKTITGAQLTRYLKSLLNLGILIKEGGTYVFPDPIVREASKEL